MKRVLQPLGGSSGRRQNKPGLYELAAAALYRLVALGFAYPDRMQLNAMGGAILDALGAASDGTVAPAVAPTLRTLLRSWRKMPAQSLAEEYSRLFLSAGLVPLREGGYGDGLRFAGQPFDIADLNGFYAAFGFELASDAPSPPDHLGTETEFVSLLHLKKALALHKGKLHCARIVDQALARFLEDHLGRWAAGLGVALREVNAASPYTLLATLLAKAVVADCARLGVKPPPARRGTARDPLEGDRFVCPLAGRDAAKEPAGIAA